MDTEERSPLPEVGRFTPWQPPTCPVLPQFPGRLEASRALLWMLNAQYPECQRLQGGGFCATCMTDVVAVRDGDTAPSGQAAVVRKATALAEKAPQKADEPKQPEGPRWRPI